jgi:hydrogenase-4 component B
MAMAFPMAGLALLCLVLGVFPSIALDPIFNLVPFAAPPPTAPAMPVGSSTAAVAAALAFVIAALVLLRLALLRRNGKRAHGTWACGFAYSTPRMQYTASSFADPVLHIFRGVLRPRSVREERLSGRFLLEMRYETHVRDLFENGLYLPVYRLFLRLAFLARRLHPGYIHLYLAYLLGTVVILLVLFR